MYNALMERKCDYLTIYPGRLYLLMNYLKKSRKKIPRYKAIIVQGNILSGVMKEKLETFFGARLIDTYGSAEFKEIAYTCKKCGNLHINSDIIYPEFIPYDKKNNIYELVLTGLIPNAVPLIRYKTGDLVVKTFNEKCSRNNFDLFTEVVGRKGDVIIFKSRKYYPKQICDFMAGLQGLDLFKVEQKSRNLLVIDLDVNPSRQAGIVNKIKDYFKGFDIEIHNVDFNNLDVNRIITTREKFKFVSGITNKE